ncbi:putative metal-dependent enzyme [Rubrobacter radiotolerans]|uniref:DUF1385 domain-containing protein n=1 Tax=Rubrobacter radiotolerans TaxID=42256 RepID=A0A023WZ11_RUBRA|nr:DUF1385 domain-containing protein [Rubrobacter radiotolerans]AHY45323.1 putative metal-dependent enzyme [Rubrobacter radiotolerans]MDX5892735.1 DUF1385 domain-containing protein [Rubrobacter radiotolerans]SMC02384.1 Uncharacterized conserved protein YqhQ [Rubrobacter radiotolerans DSM 5868]
MAEKSEVREEETPVGEERLTLGGMARIDGLDLFGPGYMTEAYRKDGEVHVRLREARARAPENERLAAFSRLPVIRSFFFWGRLLLQVVGSVWAVVFFGVTILFLWLVVQLFEAGSESLGPFGLVFEFFASFPILPVLFLFLLVMRFSPIGRYHGAEHKVVAAYETYGEVDLEKARGSSRLHPRCGTNILAYIMLAGLIDPLVGWWGYAILQFILISEAWYVFGQSRPSVAVGNFLQRYFTTTEPRRRELEVAVEGINNLLAAERGAPVPEKAVLPARF